MRTTLRLGLLQLLLVMFCGVAHASWQFGAPVNLGPVVNSTSQDSTPSISSDGLTLYFFSDRPGGEGGWDLWSTTRASLGDPWGAPVNLGTPLNSGQSEASPNISTDGLSLYFERGVSSRDIWVATRGSLADPWSSPTALAAVNSSSLDTDPNISSDGLALYFGSDRPGGDGRDIYVSTRPSTSDPWGAPVNVGSAINGPSLEDGASISTDGLSLFFMSDRDDPGSSFDLFVSERATTASDWGSATKVNISLPAKITDSAPDISFDGAILYFASTRPGGEGSLDLWSATLVPEPQAVGLAVACVAGLVLVRRRLRRLR